MSSDYTIQIGLAHVQLLRGDITKIKVDAIVNAANSELIGGSGVDGAIHAAGGPALMEQLDEIRRQIRRCEPGQAVVTGAGQLPARYVFHAVGPIYRGGDHGEAEALASCYRVCLDLAVEHSAKSIAFPSISTGVYRYPRREAAGIALATVTEWLRLHSGTLETVKLIQFSEEDRQVYREQAQSLRDQLQAGAHG